MNFTLRPWNIGDLDSLVKYANNPNIANNLMDKFPYPYSIGDVWIVGVFHQAMKIVNIPRAKRKIHIDSFNDFFIQ